MTIIEKLLNIQYELKAPKNNRNSFGGYNYRSTEDIMEAVKPLLKKYEVALVVSDEVVEISERHYIKATASIIDKDNNKIEVTGFARESLDKKGMDLAQITGSCSSYARKYALNGLFAIDETKNDPDATNDHGAKENIISKFEEIDDAEIPFDGPSEFKTLSEVTTGRRRRRRD